ncbi:hypothetical protein QN416_23315 [Glaciimonas sp. Cout2]|uniref:hypothetical protein n=1 Tax=Glaciimonas sp. Cout2 TaxID=3048621 RepID=UPI002B237AA9|nr:hypothetical protein [Glaciimonas sp. Cout2]MEB0014529.1 hypothetical protein [Glaciimonas sp. Cout2]
MKIYLIYSIDESVVRQKPRCVVAESGPEALQKYLRLVYSKDPQFRKSVLDLAVNLTFVERFYLSSPQEQDRFHETGVCGTEIQIVQSRVKIYFSERPEFGERFLQFMETQDQSLISDDIFEFIAVSETEDEHGFDVIDILDIGLSGVIE